MTHLGKVAPPIYQLCPRSSGFGPPEPGGQTSRTDVKGNSVDVKGNSADVKGNGVDVNVNLSDGGQVSGSKLPAWLLFVCLGMRLVCDFGQ
eukprot:9481928-Pyramimonas_sp.AAC.1